MEKIDSIYDFTDKGLVELKSWLEPWFLTRCRCSCGASASYGDLVMSHLCLGHYWPGDETTGSLIDRKGAWDMDIHAHSSYPVYGQVGPFVSNPELTAVGNSGTGEQRFAKEDLSGFLGGSSPYSIEFWVRVASFSAYLFGVDADSLLGQMYSFGSGQLLFERGSGSYVLDPDPLPLNQWHHIVGNYDGTDITLYRNGNLIGTNTGTATGGGGVATGRFAWGNQAISSTTWAPIDGRIAQMAVYNCPLTEEDISAHILAAGLLT